MIILNRSLNLLPAIALFTLMPLQGTKSVPPTSASTQTTKEKAKQITLTDEDITLLRMALKDLFHSEKERSFHDRSSIFIPSRTTPGKSFDPFPKNYKPKTPVEQAKADRYRRSFADLPLDKVAESPEIIMKDPVFTPHAIEFSSRFHENYPTAVAIAEVELPGYSLSHSQAVICFSFGPTAHGASVYYEFVKSKSGWTMSFKEFFFQR